MRYHRLSEYITPRGFTLVEIMMAIFIFAIIIILLFSSHNLVLSNTNVVTEGIETSEMMKTCIDRMISDLRSLYLNLPPAYAPPDFDDPPDSYRIVGDTTDIGAATFSRLRFTSSAHLSFRYNPTPEGITEIVYYVHENDEGTPVLRRADTLYPFGEFEERETDPVLCETVRSLTFTYYDKEGTSYESWNSDSPDVKYATPRAIGIILQVGEDAASRTYETMVYFPVYRRETE